MEKSDNITDVKAEIRAAVSDAIRKMGMDMFRKTSFFGSNHGKGDGRVAQLGRAGRS